MDIEENYTTSDYFLFLFRIGRAMLFRISNAFYGLRVKIWNMCLKTNVNEWKWQVSM